MWEHENQSMEDKIPWNIVLLNNTVNLLIQINRYMTLT